MERTVAPTSVYKYFDARGILIYVGITGQGHGRAAQHNRRAEWWRFVASQEVEHHPSRPVALEREEELIRDHCPPFNKQHNESHDEMKRVYLSLPEYRPSDVLHELASRRHRLPLTLVSATERTGRRKGLLLTFCASVADFDFARQIVVPRDSRVIAQEVCGPAGNFVAGGTRGPFVFFDATVKARIDHRLIESACLKIVVPKTKPATLVADRLILSGRCGL